MLAHQQRKTWGPDVTLNTTALVNELYLKLADRRLSAENRAHFLAIAATAMRHILCDYARERRRQKRGGGAEHVSLLDADAALCVVPMSDDQAETLTALDDALHRLAQVDEQQCQIVECRFFAGLDVADTAVVLGISPATVKRRWALARAWLHREIRLQLRLSE